MELIDRIDHRPGFTTFGGGGGNAAMRFVLRRAGTITAARLSANRPGSPVVEAWKDGCADYLPPASNRIMGVAPPTVSLAGLSEDTGLTEWTTGFDVDSVNDVTRVPTVPTGAVY